MKCSRLRLRVFTVGGALKKSPHAKCDPRVKKQLAVLILCSALSGCAVLSSKEATIGCQVADVATTALAIHGGAVEANPIMASILSAGGWPAFIVVKILVTWFLLEVREEAPDGVAIANGVTCAAAVNNALLL